MEDDHQIVAVKETEQPDNLLPVEKFKKLLFEKENYTDAKCNLSKTNDNVEIFALLFLTGQEK